MDGDLQNPPEDLPKLVDAVESGYDVASGRRAARRDSWGRTLPVAADQRHAPPLHRASPSPTSAAPSTPTGARRSSRCSARSASRSSRRRSSSRPARASSRSTSATRRGPTTRATRRSGSSARRSACSPASGRSRSSGSALALGAICTLFALALGVWGVVYWIDRTNFPGPLFGGVAVLFVLGVQGFILALVGEYLGRIQRDVEGRPLYTIDRGADDEARPRHRRRGVHLLDLRPPSARGDAVRGRLARRAHVRGQPREPRRRDGARAALVRARRHPRPRARPRARLPRWT